MGGCALADARGRVRDAAAGARHRRRRRACRGVRGRARRRSTARARGVRHEGAAPRLGGAAPRRARHRRRRDDRGRARGRDRRRRADARGRAPRERPQPGRARRGGRRRVSGWSCSTARRTSSTSTRWPTGRVDVLVRITPGVPPATHASMATAHHGQKFGVTRRGGARAVPRRSTRRGTCGCGASTSTWDRRSRRWSRSSTRCSGCRHSDRSRSSTPVVGSACRSPRDGRARHRRLRACARRRDARRRVRARRPSSSSSRDGRSSRVP